MSFASPVFLWYFMPATLLLYWLLPARFRNAVVAAVSLLFYTYGAGSFVFALVGLIAGNFAAGILIDGRFSERERARRLTLVAVAVLDLGVLAVWKYGEFAQRQVDSLVRLFGGHGFDVVHLVLPIGISFFTFHHLSYVIDVYRRNREAQRHPLHFVTYIAMFPQLIAGPIVRYHEIADQLPQVRSNRLEDLAEGFPRFALGLAKKVVVADQLAPLANATFALHPGQLTTGTAWLGALAYTLQIYFDFSGYSDMAIGLGRMFGFRLPENFARPYSATSITDFWRRWHMSLSRWFRDYLYIPLGGNRGTTRQTYRNLYIVFGLTGFWHGAAWPFLVWGLYHGTLLVIERVTGVAKWADEVAHVPRRAVTLLLVVVGWIPFRASNLGHAAGMLQAMFWPTGGRVPETVGNVLTHQVELTLVLASLVFLLPGSFVLGKVLEASRARPAVLARVGMMTLAAPYAALLVAAGTFSPFLYFQF